MDRNQTEQLARRLTDRAIELSRRADFLDEEKRILRSAIMQATREIIETHRLDITRPEPAARSAPTAPKLSPQESAVQFFNGFVEQELANGTSPSEARRLAYQALGPVRYGFWRDSLGSRSPVGA